VRATNEHELLQSVCQILVEVGGIRMAWVGVCEDDPQKTVRPLAMAGHAPDYVENAKISWSDETDRGRGPTGIAIRTGKPYWAKDFRADPTLAPWRDAAVAHGYASYVALPLIMDGTSLGVMNLYAGKPNAFNERSIQQYTDLANNLAYGVTALRTQEQRKRAEEALRDSEQRLLDIVDNTSSVLFVKDLANNLAYGVTALRTQEQRKPVVTRVTWVKAVCASRIASSVRRNSSSVSLLKVISVAIPQTA
jgi:two-component system cell cycle sensor histidine kinase/response regulator CckA